MGYFTQRNRQQMVEREGEKQVFLYSYPRSQKMQCIRKGVCLILHNLIEIIIIFKFGFVVLINYKHMVCKIHAAGVN